MRTESTARGPSGSHPNARSGLASWHDDPKLSRIRQLTTVLCCLPAGIPAIVYAAQVNGKLQAGDVAGAKAASDNAKMWCWISFGLGLGVFVVYGILAMVG